MLLSVSVVSAVVPLPYSARKHTEFRSSCCNRRKHLWVLKHKSRAQETQGDLQPQSGYAASEGCLVPSLYLHLNSSLSFERGTKNTSEGSDLSIPVLEFPICKAEIIVLFWFGYAKYAEEGGEV